MAQAKSKTTNVPVISLGDKVPSFRGESARSRTYELAVTFDGKPVSDFRQAWEADQENILGPEAKHVKGTAKAKETAAGWVRWLTRQGFIVIK